MYGDVPRWTGFVLAVLGFLTLVRPWPLIVAGLVGAAGCIALGRVSVVGLMGAAVCGAIAVAGIALQLRSSRSP